MTINQRICDKSVIELTLFNYSYTSKILIHNTENEDSVFDIYCFKISHSKTSYFSEYQWVSYI